LGVIAHFSYGFNSTSSCIHMHPPFLIVMYCIANTIHLSITQDWKKENRKNTCTAEKVVLLYFYKTP